MSNNTQTNNKTKNNKQVAVQRGQKNVVKFSIYFLDNILFIELYIVRLKHSFSLKICIHD